MTGSELKTWRQRHGMGQQDLADKLGVHLQTVSKWERDIQAIPPFLLLALESLERKKKPKRSAPKK